MEKAVAGNIYSKKMIAYRNVPDCELLELARIAEENQIIPDVSKLNGLEDDEELDSGETSKHHKRVTLDAGSTHDLINPNAYTLQPLWAYRCELTRGRLVSFVAWNELNEDIIAIGYGPSKFGNSQGLILVWSIKNPDWPERVIRCEMGVTAISFSKVNPSLLAAGFQTGHIIIYDIRSKDSNRKGYALFFT